MDFKNGFWFWKRHIRRETQFLVFISLFVGLFVESRWWAIKWLNFLLQNHVPNLISSRKNKLMKYLKHGRYRLSETILFRILNISLTYFHFLGNGLHGNSMDWLCTKPMSPFCEILLHLLIIYLVKSSLLWHVFQIHHCLNKKQRHDWISKSSWTHTN